MDQFNVPRKVNRHVYKAFHNLVVPGEYVSEAEILHEVRYTMRNLNPTTDLPGFVKKSIFNMKLLGILNEKDKMYSLRDRSENRNRNNAAGGTVSGSAEDADDDDVFLPLTAEGVCVGDLFRPFTIPTPRRIEPEWDSEPRIGSGEECLTDDQKYAKRNERN